jgi:glycosyltransferase involved in cell wall biosynthesis
MRSSIATRSDEPGTKGRLLIINARGFGRVEPFYPALSALGWQTTLLELPESPILRWYSIARSFRPNLAGWHTQVELTTNRIAHTAFAFKHRSRQCGNMIRNARVHYDLILLMGGMFALDWPLPAQEYALMCDCTTKLGEGEPYTGIDFASPTSAQRWYALERRLYQNARCIFSASDYVTRSLVDDFGVDPECVLTVGEGCSLEASKDLHNVYDGKSILFVGYDFQRKGGEVLLEAFKRVTAVIPDAELVIAGPLSIGCPVPPGVRFLGAVSRHQLSDLYARASLFVMPSLFEPFGLVFLEAMEHRLPCIGSDRCAMPEIIVDGETGAIVPAGDANTLADRIVYLLRHPQALARMGVQGRARVRQRFTWQAVARRMDERLLGLLSSRTAGRPSRFSAQLSARARPTPAL